MGRSELSWMFPAPPRPLLNLEPALERLVSTRAAGPRAVVPFDVLGALKVFPAPPRPEWMNLPGCGCGSVIWYWTGMLIDVLRFGGNEVVVVILDAVTSCLVVK